MIWLLVNLTALLGGQEVAAILDRNGGGDVEGDGHVVAWLQTGCFNGPHDEFERFAVRFQSRAIAAFVADQVAFVAGVIQQLPQPAIDADDPFQAGWIIRCAARNDEDVLNVEIAPRVLAAGDHVGHGAGQGLRLEARGLWGG